MRFLIISRIQIIIYGIVLAIIQLILEDENYTEECKRKIKITLTELLKREKANAVKEQAEEIMRWL